MAAREAAPAASPVSTASVQVFIDRWQEIRTEVKAIDRKVEALLASTDPYNVIDGTLYLVAAYPFHAGKLNEDRNRMTIEAAIERVTNERISVVTALRDELPDLEPGPGPAPAPAPQRPQPRRVAETPPEPEAAPVNGAHDPDGADDDEEAERERQIMERMKALFDGEEVDIDSLPVDINSSS